MCLLLGCNVTCFTPMFVTVSPPHAPYFCPTSECASNGVLLKAFGGAMESHAPESTVMLTVLGEAIVLMFLFLFAICDMVFVAVSLCVVGF